MARKQRKGEYVCTCRAYPHPHRFTGGKCTLLGWVRRFWQKEPHSSDCQECHNYRLGECDVDQGTEGPMECVALEQFLHDEEITIPVRFRRKKR